MLIFYKPDIAADSIEGWSMFLKLISRLACMAEGDMRLMSSDDLPSSWFLCLLVRWLDLKLEIGI